jgi:hypothetical protein
MEVDIKKYRKKLIKRCKNFFPFDYSCNLDIFRESIVQTRDYIRDHGIEEDDSRLERVKEMDGMIYLLELLVNDDFQLLAEIRLNQKYPYDNNVLREVLRVSEEIKSETYDNLFSIMKNKMEGWWD